MLIDSVMWEHWLHQVWDSAQGNEVMDVLDLLSLLDLLQLTYPDIDMQPFLDIIICSMLMDIDGLLDSIGQEQHQTFDELHLCYYQVAGTVRLMSMPIFKN
jgi:hypothetical protein